MLHVARAAQALEANRSRFTGYDQKQSGEMASYRATLSRLEAMSTTQIRDSLPHAPTGSLPGPEWDTHRKTVLEFQHRLANHEEARSWAADALYDRMTFAVDGSQIQPMPDISVPVAAVQVGWFENPHSPGIPYTKDVLVEILPPDEVFVARAGVSVFSDQAVSLRRFALEVDVLCRWMEEHAGVLPRPVAFFDGSLVVSFAERMEPQVKDFYVGSVVRLLETSEATGVPLVGYVDNSRARDLVTLLRLLSPELQPADGVTDAALLSSSMRWGDRTPAWICNREGVLAEYVGADGSDLRDSVAFVYLKTTTPNPPARLDIPRWAVDKGLTEEIVECVRGECVVGNGYPYAIETADAVAVITAEDRLRFYGLFEQFAEKNGIRLRVASKIQSKLRRR